MWVQAIELEHWRLFDQRRIRVAGLSPGVNLVIGPNEAGKSTLVDAMARLFFDRPKTSSASQLRPWGSDVTPEGALEFEAAGQLYRIEKRFHPTSGSAVLRLDRGSGFVDFRQDEGVQDFVHALIGGQRVARGLSRYENWGLLRLLWALQDESVVPAEPSPEVQERLGPLLGRDPLADPGQVQPLLQEVERRFALWFTPTGTKARKGSPITEREEESARLEADLVRLEQDLSRTRELGRRIKEDIEEDKELLAGFAAEDRRREELALASRRYEDLQLLHVQAGRRHEAALSEQRQAAQLLDQLKEASVQLQLHQGHIERAEARLVELRASEDRARAERADAEARFQAAQEALAAAQAAAQKSAARRDALQRLLGRHEEAERARAAEQQALARLQEADLAEHKLLDRESAAIAARQAAQDREQAAQAAAEAAAAEQDRSRLLQERRELAIELERVAELETQVARLDAARGALHPASEEDLRLLESLEAEEIRARATMQAERVVLELYAEKDLKAVVRVDGRLEEETLTAKASRRFEGVQLRLVLPGVATLAVGRPGAGEQAARKLEDLERRSAELLARYGAADLEALRTDGQRARQLEREAELRREELRGRKPRSRIEARLGQLPQEGLGLEAAAERLGVVQAEHKKLQAALRKADKDLESCRQALSQARQEAQRHREDRRGSAGRAAALAEQLAAEAEALGLQSAARDVLEAASAQAVHVAVEQDRAVPEAQAGLEPLRLALAGARERAGAVEKQIAATEADLRSQRIAHSEVQSRRFRVLDGRSEEALREQLSALGGTVEEALRQRARLEDLPGVDPRLELVAIESSLKQLRKDRDERQLRQVRLEQELEHLASLGLYEQMAGVRERLAVCRRELDAENLKASATRHLKELLESAQEDARRKLGGPIREWIALRAREVLGDQVSGVHFSSGLVLDRVTRRGLSEPAAVSDLSRGTRDILGLLVRLGMADLVSRQERQLVVLDDVLVHADASRRRRLLKILQEAAAQVQILICTCHADQYAALGEEAKRFDLEQVKAGSI